MKLHLTIEYEVKGEDGISEELEAYHSEMFERDPIEFISSIWSNDKAEFKYTFESSEKKQVACHTDIEFDCEMYLYTKNQECNICLKYGVLCGNVICQMMK